MICLVLISTIYHLYLVYKSSVRRDYCLDRKEYGLKFYLHEVLLCFSLIKSISKIIKVKKNDLNFLCGIKFLSMTFIIVGHTLIFTFGGPVANTHYLYEVIYCFHNEYLKKIHLFV